MVRRNSSRRANFWTLVIELTSPQELTVVNPLLAFLRCSRMIVLVGCGEWTMGRDPNGTTMTWHRRLCTSLDGYGQQELFSPSSIRRYLKCHVAKQAQSSLI